MAPESTDTPERSAAKIATTEHKYNAPFLRLPAELRNYIYTLVAVRQQLINFARGGQPIAPPGLAKLVAQPALARPVAPSEKIYSPSTAA